MKKIIEKLSYIMILMTVLLLSGCKKDLLEVYPLDALSEANFWKNEKDAYLALVGLYENDSNYDRARSNSFWGSGAITVSFYTDDARGKGDWTYPYIQGNMGLSDGNWVWNYQVIMRCNIFLENIGKCEMDADKKAEMIAEAKFLRSFGYFWLSQLFGDVPLNTKVLTLEEANTLTQNSKADVTQFILDELTAAIPDLPASRPEAESGRIVKSAALAVKGRLLMAEKRWSEAADAFKAIIDLGVHSIDPRFSELFTQAGEGSPECIWAKTYQENIAGETVTQVAVVPMFFNGWGELNIFQGFVDEFKMTDGLTIEESPLFDIDHPWENRDPRLYATVLLPGYSVFRGMVFQGHPDSTLLGIASAETPGATGYAMRKYLDEGYNGDQKAYGGDYTLIRYAEVLLSYLESKLEAGDIITQALLDETINKVRGRAAVNMPFVTETAPDELRKIVRSERRVELAFESGLRYWDLLRWRTAHIELNKKMYGMRLTNDPGSYTGGYTIDEKGFYFSLQKQFNESKDYLIPIPQSELDINKNLTQNTGY